MGWRNGAYATVWSWTDKTGKQRVVNSISDKLSTAKISIRVKDRRTDEYVTQFNNFVKFVGSVPAHKALGLKERDRIRLLEVDYIEDPERKKVDPNYKGDFIVYDFEIQNDRRNGASRPATTSDQPVDEFDEPSELPF